MILTNSSSSHHSVEVHQEHPENHKVHEDGGGCQVRSRWEAAETRPRLRRRCPVYVCVLSLFYILSLLSAVKYVKNCLRSPALYEKADIKVQDDKAAKHLLIGVTSDRGLCGAIHSGVAKMIKSEIAVLTGAGKDVMVINVGDKLRGLLHRYTWKLSVLLLHK